MTAVREIALYEHQKTAVEAARGGIRDGLRRQVLVAPTAFGKTECAAYILLKALEKGSRVWFVVDRVALINQTSKRFALYGIDHGVIQADHELTAPNKPCQIVSAQTIGRRVLSNSSLPDLIVWDECHCVYASVLRIIEKAARAKVLGLTATPFTPGMAEQWDGVVNGATVNYLLGANPEGRKFLTPLKIKACVAPDMVGVRKIGGEYEQEAAGSRGIVIVGDVVQTWVEQTRKHFGGPAKTIVFSPSVKHGAELCRQFADAGFNFQQISYLDGDEADRQAKLDEFAKRDSAIDGLVSCAVLTKGFDVPDVLCGISCRPYRKSFSSHIQEMGRVMRISEETGKTFGLWLDHSGNCIRFAEDTAYLYEYGVDSLSAAAKQDSTVREVQERVKKELFCADCGTQMVPKCEACPDCGWERPKRGEIQIVQGELIDVAHNAAVAFKPRSGLRADCLESPKRIWNAALTYCLAASRGGPESARKWAFGVWAGIYPGSRLPRGLYDLSHDPVAVTAIEWGLIDREVKRHRRTSASRKRAN